MTSELTLSDQFYSWYIYPDEEEDYGKSISSAEFIDNVNQDPVVIVNGLTKVSLLVTSGINVLCIEDNRTGVCPDGESAGSSVLRT